MKLVTQEEYDDLRERFFSETTRDISTIVICKSRNGRKPVRRERPPCADDGRL